MALLVDGPCKIGGGGGSKDGGGGGAVPLGGGTGGRPGGGGGAAPEAKLGRVASTGRAAKVVEPSPLLTTMLCLGCLPSDGTAPKLLTAHLGKLLHGPARPRAAVITLPGQNVLSCPN